VCLLLILSNKLDLNQETRFTIHQRKTILEWSQYTFKNNLSLLQGDYILTILCSDKPLSNKLEYFQKHFLLSGEPHLGGANLLF
jgi:hypothetical protein